MSPPGRSTQPPGQMPLLCQPICRTYSGHTVCRSCNRPHESTTHRNQGMYCAGLFRNNGSCKNPLLTTVKLPNLFRAFLKLGTLGNSKKRLPTDVILMDAKPFKSTAVTWMRHSNHLNEFLFSIRRYLGEGTASESIQCLFSGINVVLSAIAKCFAQ